MNKCPARTYHLLNKLPGITVLQMADVVRDLMIKLGIKEKEIVVLDLEAGVESFGRGMERGVDTVLVIVEPSFESLALADKIRYMAEGIGIGRVRAILNKMPSEKIAQKIIKELIRKAIRHLGAVYIDPQVSEAGLEGTSLGDSKAKEQLKTLARLMLDEAEMKYKKDGE